MCTIYIVAYIVEQINNKTGKLYVSYCTVHVKLNHSTDIFCVKIGY